MNAPSQAEQRVSAPSREPGVPRGMFLGKEVRIGSARSEEWQGQNGSAIGQCRQQIGTGVSALVSIAGREHGIGTISSSSDQPLSRAVVLPDPSRLHDEAMAAVVEEGVSVRGSAACLYEHRLPLRRRCLEIMRALSDPPIDSLDIIDTRKGTAQLHERDIEPIAVDMDIGHVFAGSSVANGTTLPLTEASGAETEHLANTATKLVVLDRAAIYQDLRARATGIYNQSIDDAARFRADDPKRSRFLLEIHQMELKGQLGKREVAILCDMVDGWSPREQNPDLETGGSRSNYDQVEI